MKIQVNTDKNVVASPDLLGSVERDVEQALARFAEEITRVEVHLSDLNSSKRGGQDKRCLIEVRSAGKKPVSADQQDATVDRAVKGALAKMKRLLQSSFGRAAHQTSRASLGKGKRAMTSGGTAEKLERITAELSDLIKEVDGESLQVARQIQSAAQALEKARSLAASRKSAGTGARPAKAAATDGRAPASPKKTLSAAKGQSVNGRSPKKKSIYRARRKSWPKR